ncbi:hypothetical protein OC846_003818 [Tilletia horrida]|uniref:Uncharacterized protein n=1 Tax=Tilletia horrida TaxID=155126 RepID=A0AAN6JRN7_9BASI|nr:hypothetical protein OC846_003818 [Tilletia horrida]KAK0565079.1 hypothetical protein OC861_003939 [Tilletia horrida]
MSYLLSPSSERMPAESSWLEALQEHPIFDPSNLESAAASSSTSSPALFTTKHDAVNPQVVCVRHTDLIVAVGRQLRIAQLLDIKRSSGSSTLGTPQKAKAEPPALPTYKTLDTPQIDFDIIGIAVNPNGKLLVAYGTHRLAVVILPRIARGKISSARLPAKVVQVGQYYHNEHNGPCARVAKIVWHPLGQGSTSLLVATRDGILREYELGGDAEEPVQVISLLPAHLQRRTAAQLSSFIGASGKPKSSRRRDQAPRTSFGFGTPTKERDEHGTETVDTELASFCMGWDQHPQSPSSLDTAARLDSDTLSQDDWAPFTLYALLRNGDVYATCPFLPAKLAITAAGLERLSAYVSACSGAQQLESDGVDGGEDEDLLQHEMEQTRITVRFTNLLSKQASRAVDAARRNLARGTNTNGKRAEPAAYESAPTAARGSSKIADAAALEVNSDELLVDLTNPWLHNYPSLPPTRATHPRLVPQGPFLLIPAPVELSDERESQASDICLTRIVVAGVNDKPHRLLGSAVEKAELSVLSIVGNDGRVDVCVITEPIGPRWDATAESSQSHASRRGSSVRTGRYALSDSEDEDVTSAGQSFSTREGRSIAYTPGQGDISGTWPSTNGDDTRLLPSVIVYETVDLGLGDPEAAERGAGQANVLPTFILDPMYRDKIYVYHAEGLHCLSFSSWVWKLLHIIGAAGEDPPASSHFSDPASALPGRVAEELKYFLADKISSRTAHLVKTVAMPSPEAPSTYTINGVADSQESRASIPVVGYSLILDAYLGYSGLAVTLDGQGVALELTLSSITPGGPASNDGRMTKRSKSSRSGPEDEQPPYVSLLQPDGPFVPPDLLNTPAGMPVQPRLVLAAAGQKLGASSGPGSALLQEALKAAGASLSPTAPLQTITPVTLRFLTKAFQALQAEIRDVKRAANRSQARLDLQYRELTRLLDGLSAARNRYEKIAPTSPSGDGPTPAAGVRARMDRAVARQKELMQRLDKVLQRLVDGHAGPRLSEQEEEWFAELRDMAGEIGVDPDQIAKDAAAASKGALVRGPLAGLRADIDKLQHQLELIKPALQEISRAEAEARLSKASQTQPRYGKSQLRALEEALSTESDLVQRVKSRITEMHFGLGKAVEAA